MKSNSRALSEADLSAIELRPLIGQLPVIRQLCAAYRATVLSRPRKHNMPVDLTKIKIGFSPLSQELFIFRHGKDPQLALDKREAMADVMGGLIEFMMYDSPKGASQIISFGPKRYKVTVQPEYDPQ